MTWFLILLILGVIAIVCGFYLPVQQPARKLLTTIGIVLLIAAIVVLVLSLTVWKHTEVVPVSPTTVVTTQVTPTP